MKPDTLLLVTTSYPQRGDGSEAAGAFVADLVAAFSDRVPVRVVAPGESSELYEESPNIQVRRFQSPGRPLSLLSASRPADWPAIIRTLRSLRAETLAANKDGRVAHTLALWALPSGWAAGLLKHRDGVPYSVWALGSDIWSLGRIPIVKTILRNTIRGAKYRFADGLKLGADATTISGLPFEFLPSMRSLGAHHFRSFLSGPPYRLLFLGRWHPNKGIDLLLAALLQLGGNDWNFIAEVHIAGGGPLDGHVRNCVEMLRDAGRPVRLDGFLNREQAVAALSAADFLLLPSRIESIPVIFSDAMQMRLPVVSMPVGDLPLLIKKYGVGILAAEVSVQSFAEALKEALKTGPKEFARGMGDCADQFKVDIEKLCADFGC